MDVIVYAFQNINFSLLNISPIISIEKQAHYKQTHMRPIRPNSPKRRPNPTPKRRLLDIKHIKPLIINLPTNDPHTIPTLPRRQIIPPINLHDDFVVAVDVGETAPGLVARDVVYLAVCGVGAGEEIPGVEEGAAGVGVLRDPEGGADVVDVGLGVVG